jgi:hypothetical protein
MATKAELTAQRREHYRLMLETVKEYATGFTKKAGYNIDKFEKITKYKKSKIRKYFTAIQDLTARPQTTYTSRDKQKLEKVQRATQGRVLKQLKVAFIPTTGDPEHKPKVELVGNKVRVHYAHLTNSYVPIPSRLLAIDPEKAAIHALNQVPDLNHFKILAGDSAIIGVYDRKTVLKEIARLSMKYSAAQFDATKNSSHYFGNWMHGLLAFDPKKSATGNEQQIADFLKRKRDAQEEIRKQRKKEQAAWRKSISGKGGGGRPGR